MFLDRINIPVILWYIHFLACFAGLAYLPFSRMFHIIAGPLSLLSNAVMDDEISDPANVATRQVMELDACTHCSTCSTQCLVGICYEAIPNINILPSERIAALKRLAAGKKLEEHEVRKIQEGLYLCSNCHRCTLVCPVGINLQELWFTARESFFQKGYPELLTLTPLSYYRGLKKQKIENRNYNIPMKTANTAITKAFELFNDPAETINISFLNKSFKNNLLDSIHGDSFPNCYTCTICTSTCPVVNIFDNPLKALGLVPHQIIHAAKVGLSDMIFRSRMLWSCLGCYQCQDACPQGVKITEVFYELKNMAASDFNRKILTSTIEEI